MQTTIESAPRDTKTREKRTGKPPIETTIMIAKLSRKQQRIDWEDQMCLACMAIAEEECAETRVLLAKKLWGR